jgi:UDP-glucuronate decarboxylase
MMGSPDGFTGPVNAGNPEEVTILSLARKIIEIAGSRSKVVFSQLPEDDPRRRKPDISLARKALGWNPGTELEAGLERTINYFKSNLGL